MKKVTTWSLACVAWQGVAFAQATEPAPQGTLPEISVTASPSDSKPYGTATKAVKANMSSIPLSETPQSITVLPPALLESQQAQSLGDALNHVAGVVSQTFGRRGWDDFIIRGQTASDAVFVDGLRTSSSNRVAQELFGFEGVEVLKGPASLLYGQVMPGGLVSMTSKRPQSDASGAAALTVGSFGFREATFDVNQPLSDSGKAAFRINGLVMNSDDPTDHVFFKSRFIAPTLSLDLGPRTDLTLLSSYQDRQYVRQQGLPVSGSVQSNPNGKLSLSTFTGETTQNPYQGYQSRVGYALTHRFDSGWTLYQNARHQEYQLTGQLTSISSLAANGYTLKRSVTDQNYDGTNNAIDTHVQKLVASDWGSHEITLGTDYSRDQEHTLSRTCTVASLNVYDPVYGAAITCPASYKTNSLVTTRDFGVYGRDQLLLTDKMRVVLGLRHDTLSVSTDNALKGTHQGNPASATTGSVALMYEVHPGVRPYLSYATSFFPNTGVDAENQTFKPESGKQIEAGVKWDLAPRISLTAAVYDLRRRNVLQTDPNNTDYSIAVGEQTTQGAELGVSADFESGLSLFGGYAYNDAKVTEAGAADASTVGQRLNNVPRNSFTLSSRYRLHDAWKGWELNGAIRGQDQARAYTYDIPGYAVADLGIGYSSGHWRTAFNVKNVFDKHYYVGGVAAAVAVGTERTALMTVAYRY